ncbi:peptidoglycan DD-metalloendopeptidase family protein [Ectobacillus sp. sgz5001026]|uniref:peptidoglycan DD-metalloendopeptidase family protein n=1 Tax=Ectobacillus sp. sgz5001026 TaxID=3242473 RepID=UPI0036D42918
MRDGENKQSRKVVRLFQKRWVFPVVYIASAAVILTGALWYQMANDNQDVKPVTPLSQHESPSVPVTKVAETVKLPVADAASVSIKKKFYEDKAPAAEQEQALVFYNNTYSPNTGIDLVAGNGEKMFDVTAAVSGTVTKAEKDALLGYVVTVDSENGVSTFYQSLNDSKVEVGQSITQGQVIGQAGLSEMNKELGYHVHFEIRKDGVAVNPEKFLDKSLADVKVEQASAPAKDDKTKDPATDKPQTDNQTPGDDKQPGDSNPDQGTDSNNQAPSGNQ